MIAVAQILDCVDLGRVEVRAGVVEAAQRDKGNCEHDAIRGHALDVAAMVEAQLVRPAGPPAQTQQTRLDRTLPGGSDAAIASGSAWLPFAKIYR